MTQKTHLPLLPLFIGLLACFFSTIVPASSENITVTVQRAAEAFVAEQITVPERGELRVTAATLDSRLRLTECSAPLNTSIPGKQSLTGNVTVLINCVPENWQVYVPVRTQLLLPRVVAAKPLARGMVLGTDDLTVQQVELRFQRGVVFERPEQIIGSKMKRTVNMGEAVQGGDICLVCRNDSVNIIAGNGGLSIITKGNALSDGSLGEQIRVQNSKSKRVIDAVITGVGEVTVNY
ncbi:flagella basal body P-ring formation protein FlgA [Photobacterium sanctipauli]|uniref:Flagella basal body P-ring formation protein FlgA n=1 Tax=Photobacterium sanctipauli TaxID=1342794 RepID=A0A2T3NTV0_9GAMM|nr:flagellar basal body P-ring formation chaperone FlgA [Photobacterium sanctipauli]PSW19692.1 flagella basal body P-ring formation protein FlgA [Photobacterium sanctipauli]